MREEFEECFILIATTMAELTLHFYGDDLGADNEISGLRVEMEALREELTELREGLR